MILAEIVRGHGALMPLRCLENCFTDRAAVESRRPQFGDKPQRMSELWISKHVAHLRRCAVRQIHFARFARQLGATIFPVPLNEVANWKAVLGVINRRLE